MANSIFDRLADESRQYDETVSRHGYEGYLGLTPEKAEKPPVDRSNERFGFVAKIRRLLSCKR